MALQSSGQITASDIMAEWSYPASTQWKVSADGAGFISFAVSSIIKYSDFYNGSAATGRTYSFPIEQKARNSSGDSYSLSNANNSAAAGQASGMIIQPTDTPYGVVTGNSGGGFSAGVFMAYGTAVQAGGASNARGIWALGAGNGPPDNGNRGGRTSFTMPFTANSGSTYQLWSNYTVHGGYIGGSNNPGFVGDMALMRVQCGSYNRWWGLAKDFTMQNTIGTNGGINTSTTRADGQVYGNDQYIGRAGPGFADPRDGFATLYGLGVGQQTGPLFESIPGSQIIAAGNQITFSFYLGLPVRFSSQACGIEFGNDHTSSMGQYAVLSSTAANNWNSQDARGANGPVRYSGFSGYYNKMGGWTGSADPNNVDGTFGNSSGQDRFHFEIVETGTY